MTEKLGRFNQGRNEGEVKGATIPREPNHCADAEKSQKCHNYFLQNIKSASEELRFEHGCAKLMIKF